MTLPARSNPTPHNASDASGDAMKNALLHLLGRIEGVLEDERRVLAMGPIEDLDGIITRKNYLALDVTRMTSHVPGIQLDQMVRRSLERTTKQLAENAELLRRHIEAVGEISDLLGEIVNQASSDGTYTSDGYRRG